MKTLYDMELSGNCYKIRLLLALLGEEYRRIPVDLAGGENRRDPFLALNPRGEVPVLVDGDRVIWDSSAILVYLATQSGDRRFYPDDALSRARVAQWLAIAAHEIHSGLALARAIRLFGRSGDLAQSQATGRRALALMDERLSLAPWLVNEDFSIADVACYPYVHVAEDGGISLAPYQNVEAWCRRIEALKGFEPMIAGEPLPTDAVAKEA